MELSPDIIKMREALLERIGNKPLKEVAQIVNEILLNETDSTNRLAALAARVKVLRNYINKNFEIKNSSKKIKLLNNIENIKNSEIKDQINSNNYISDKTDNWVRVEMLKPGVVNGVRFPEGVVIDVSQKDADKLVKEELSKIIDLDDTAINMDLSEKKLEVNKEDAKQVNKEEVTQVNKEDAKLENKEEVTLENKEEVTQVNKEDAKQVNKEEVTQVNKEDAKQVNKEEATNYLDKKIDTEIKSDKKIIKTKSTKITEETIELTDPKAVAEALGLNDKKKKEDEPQEIEEEIDIEALETGKKK